MKLYDQAIRQIDTAFSGIPGQAWAFEAAQVWPDAGENELVLQRDAAYELGGGSNPAASGLFVTSNPALVASDEIRLYGPDLPALHADSPYARLVFVRTSPLGDDDERVYQAIRSIDFVKYHVFPKGYMMRASVERHREQVRVSRRAIADGISFRAVGGDFICKYHENPNVQAVRLVFVTDPAVDFSALSAAARKADDITSALNHFLEGVATDCHSCELKPICDEVEGMRELHFKNAKPRQ